MNSKLFGEEMEYTFLDKINYPEDIKGLTDDEITQLCKEIREFLVSDVTKTGGHLASNLGVVELTVAIHRVFDLPKDHLIFDVGHQCYTHKLLTGRKSGFDSLRKIGGLSGFTSKIESEYDCFGAGHSSTSVSAAIGFAEADKLKGNKAYTVAVLGDGAFTGGMIHEALNNCKRDLPLIIILNENEMSIGKNTGRFARLIARLRSSKSYYKSKNRTARFIKDIPLIGKYLFVGIRQVKKAVKNIIYSSNYFEDLGLYYIGPADGNDEQTVERLLREAVDYGKSTVIHLKTKKGKGYAPAEENPVKYHCIPPIKNEDQDKMQGGEGGSKADPGAEQNGKPETDTQSGNKVNFSKKLGEFLSELADRYPDVCAITAAMAAGTGLDFFALKHRDRFFDVGIAEEHALTFAAGLAANKMKPFFAVYSSFLQRGYDNIVHDIALQKLPVTICVDRAGLSPGDGPTHHGIFDVSFLSGIPNMTIYSPSCFETLRLALYDAYLSGGPCAVRYSNCSESDEIIKMFYKDGFDGLKPAVSDFDKSDTRKSKIIITYGRIVNEAIKAEESIGNECGIILLERLKPYDTLADEIAGLLPDSPADIVFYEEGIKNGGAGMIIKNLLEDYGIMKNKTLSLLAIDDIFRPIRQADDVYLAYGIGTSDLINVLKKAEND